MFPKQQYSFRPELLKPASMGWAFPCGPEDVPLPVGGAAGGGGAGRMMGGGGWDGA